MDVATRTKLESIRKFISVKLNKNIDVDKELQDAAKDGDLTTVKFLCDIGVDPKNNDNRVIVLAATNGHLDVVKYLCEERGCYSEFALIEAATTNNHLNIIKYIRSRGCKLIHYYRCALKTAISNKSFDVAKYFYENVKVATSITPKRDYCEIALAAATGHLEMIKYFCCTHQCKDCATSINAALENNHGPALEYLLRQYHTSPEEICNLLVIATNLNHSSCASVLIKNIYKEQCGTSESVGENVRRMIRRYYPRSE